MTLPSLPPAITSREFLRIGGGYGASACGASPAGGLDADNAGNLAMDGDLTVGGALHVAGPDRTWHLAIPMSHGAGYGAVKGTLDLGAQQPKLVYWSFPQTVWSEVCFPFVLPRGYDGAALQARLFWTAEGGTPAETVHWRVYCQSFADGEDLDGPADSLLMPLLHSGDDTYQGEHLVHRHSALFTPTAGGAEELCFLNIRRNAAPASTLSVPAWLLGLALAYA
mgnify:CR=1 FL=1